MTKINNDNQENLTAVSDEAEGLIERYSGDRSDEIREKLRDTRKRLLDLREKVSVMTKSDDYRINQILAQIDAFEKTPPAIQKPEDVQKNGKKNESETEPSEKNKKNGETDTEEREERTFKENPMGWIKDRFSKIKKAVSPGEMLKHAVELAAFLGAQLNKFTDYLTSTLAPIQASMRDTPFIGNMFKGIEKLFGPARQKFYETLAGLNITMPTDLAFSARQSLDGVYKSIASTAKPLILVRLSWKLGF